MRLSRAWLGSIGQVSVRRVKERRGDEREQTPVEFFYREQPTLVRSPEETRSKGGEIPHCHETINVPGDLVSASRSSEESEGKQRTPSRASDRWKRNGGR